MHIDIAIIAVCLLQTSFAKPLGSSQSKLQTPLEDLNPAHYQLPGSKQLHGRFLHITDLHQDPHFKALSSTDEDNACHRGKGTAGVYGAETTDCDTPHTLIDATFEWIKENIRDNIDFVVWTGDSARHDSDEEIPRIQNEVLDTNRKIADKFLDAFGIKGDPDQGLSIPVVPTFGNNDILPHNILLAGPNKWLKTYTDIWDNFIPEEQRHGFERGGWYYVEVIPNKLAVFSLNTLYFFSHNAAVDGCALRSEPGYEHMEWLRIQLQFMRDRGLKVILMGHVPPARTDSKELWDESCWQKYTLWLHQYRDIIVAGLYGHMNIDHFMIHDTKDIDLLLFEGKSTSPPRALMDDEFTIMSAEDYLEDLRDHWSKLPSPSVLDAQSIDEEDFSGASTKGSEGEEKKKKKKKKKSKKDKQKKALKKMGGPWGERFQVTHVGPSIVPNYFPTLRIIEYNITGLDNSATWSNSPTNRGDGIDWLDQDGVTTDDIEDYIHDVETGNQDDASAEKKKSKKPKKPKKPKKKKPSNPDLIVPSPPSESAPPGPAYSPQTLTLLGYTQYYANLTYINNVDYAEPEAPSSSEDDLNTEKWRKGKHGDKVPAEVKPHPNAFHYQVEYDTFTDPIYKMKDMTVKSYLKLAHRIGQYKPEKGDNISDGWFTADAKTTDEDEDENEDEKDDTQVSITEKIVDTEMEDDDVETEKKKKKHKGKKHKHRKQHEKNRVWLRFVRRAFVSTLSEEEYRSSRYDSDAPDEASESQMEGSHDFEL